MEMPDVVRRRDAGEDRAQRGSPGAPLSDGGQASPSTQERGARRARRASGEALPERVVRLATPVVAVAFLAVALAVLVLFLADPSLVTASAVLLVALLGSVLVVDARAHAAVRARRAAQEASLARILQGLSRSVSPDAVVGAIVAELREASGADHAVVVRRVRGEPLLEATLVSGRTSTPASTTRFSAELLPPATTGEDAAQAEADAMAERVRGAYGLAATMSVPLVEAGGLLGALVLSRRGRGPWPAETRSLLRWAAAEVSAALGRAYRHEADAEGARLDPLTGLPNRRYFDELTTVLVTGRRQSDALGILMIDIDHFKRLNDRYGHGVGDVVLRHVASLLVRSVRDDDTPARYGGEEFVVVLRRATLEQAVEVAERIRSAVRGSPPPAPGIRDRITVSIGVAVRQPGTSLPGIVEAADRALYVAKGAGRDRVEVG